MRAQGAGKGVVKRAAGTSTVGGKFQSIGLREQQAANLVLVTRLMGDIGADGMQYVKAADVPFVDDVRYKLQSQTNGGKMFGWRQVEALVRIHKEVVEARNADN